MIISLLFYSALVTIAVAYGRRSTAANRQLATDAGLWTAVIRPLLEAVPALLVTLADYIRNVLNTEPQAAGYEAMNEDPPLAGSAEPDVGGGGMPGIHLGNPTHTFAPTNFWYAVIVGWIPGVCYSWHVAGPRVHRCTSFVVKKFRTEAEARAYYDAMLSNDSVQTVFRDENEGLT